MINPLVTFKSPNVYQLLEEFYFANFEEYGVEGIGGSGLVELIWQKKDFLPQDDLRLQVNKIFENTSIQQSKVRKEVSIIDLFDLSKVEHFVDIGANNLARVNEVARKYPGVRKLTAVDVVPQQKPFREPLKSEYVQIDPNATEYPLESNCCDFINLEFVLHHFQNEELIKSQIKTFKRILKPGAKLLLWEESFEDFVNSESLSIENQKLGIMTNQELTEKFYNLTLKERMEFIIINDWIINVNIHHMQWTGEWKSWNKWSELFESEGFILEEKYNLGLRVNGRLKQGVHMLGLFKCIK